MSVPDIYTTLDGDCLHIHGMLDDWDCIVLTLDKVEARWKVDECAALPAYIPDARDMLACFQAAFAEMDDIDRTRKR